jgi:very-short-patch-repair endonuclease
MFSAARADIERARGLRSTMTDAEERLWLRLRRDQMEGHRFRRQVPIGPYVVDFACRKARLAIEVDGGQHVAASQEDDRRSAWLASRGYTVLRFWNNQVLEETDGVLESIRLVLTARSPGPHPALPRKRGRGR